MLLLTAKNKMEKETCKKTFSNSYGGIIETEEHAKGLRFLSPNPFLIQVETSEDAFRFVFSFSSGKTIEFSYDEASNAILLHLYDERIVPPKGLPYMWTHIKTVDQITELYDVLKQFILTVNNGKPTDTEE